MYICCHTETFWSNCGCPSNPYSDFDLWNVSENRRGRGNVVCRNHMRVSKCPNACGKSWVNDSTQDQWMEASGRQRNGFSLSQHFWMTQVERGKQCRYTLLWRKNSYALSCTYYEGLDSQRPRQILVWNKRRRSIISWLPKVLRTPHVTIMLFLI